MPPSTDPLDDTRLHDRVRSALTALHDEPLEMMEPPADLRQRVAEAGIPSLTDRRKTAASRRRPAFLMAAAAALLIVAGVGGVLMFGNRSSGSEVVASAQLTRVAAPTGEVSATLSRNDGRYRLQVTMRDMPEVPQGEFVELWLADADLKDMRSVRAVPSVREGSITVDVPADVDPMALKVVDLSLEPTGGPPQHSGISLLRGTLS